MRKRQFEIVAQDPSVRRNGRVLTARISLPWEDLEDGADGLRAVRRRLRRVGRRDVCTRSARSGHRAVRHRRRSRTALADSTYHAVNVYAIVMRTLLRFEFATRPARRLGHPRAPAQDRAARLRGGQRLLLARRRGAAVRLRAQRAADVPLPVARHRRPRDGARPARRAARQVHGAVVAGPGRAARGVRRHRGAAVGVLAARGGATT